MEWECKQSTIKIKAFRGDNGVYRATEFRVDLKNNYQQITLYGVGAHH